MPSPNVGEDDNWLHAVTGSGNDVWAVGHYYSGNTFPSLILHWDGSVWSQVPAPVVDPLSGFLRAATGSGNDAWLAGYTGGTVGNPRRTLTLRWDGSAWSHVPSPNVISGDNELYAITGSGNDVWTAGNFGSSTLTLHWTEGLCATSTPTNPPASTPTHTPTGLPTAGTVTPGATGTPTPTLAITHTRTPAPTETPCSMSFSDVHPTDYAYEAVRYLYCRGVISGYGDGTFRPYNNTTRGQLCKIVVLAEGWPIYTPPTPTFSDVPAGHPFYQHIETGRKHGVISGYADGTFRPGNDVTRGQLCKIVVLAEQWPIYMPPTPTFLDAPADHPFYGHIETAYLHGIISGYAGRTFRPGNPATRGQICKIVYLAITGPN